LEELLVFEVLTGTSCLFILVMMMMMMMIQLLPSAFNVEETRQAFT
jgi:hypothetical protein